MASVRDGLVFYLRPHPELVVSDGVRAGLAWEEVVRIDGMVKLLLEMFGVSYIPIDALPMQERVRLMERVLALAGLSPVDEPGAAPVLTNGGNEHREREVELPRPEPVKNGS